MKGEGGRGRGDKLKEMKGNKLFNQQSRVVLEEVHVRVDLEGVSVAVVSRLTELGVSGQSERETLLYLFHSLISLLLAFIQLVDAFIR